MIFISKFGRYCLQCRPEVAEQYATGMGRVTQPALYAQFEPNQHNADERAEALRRFYLTGGLPQNVDEATHVEPDFRIGRFDSRAEQLDKGWTDEDRELVESELLRHCDIYPSDLFLMPEVALAAPWPAYDDFKGSAAQLAKKAYEDGHSLVEVIAYEAANRNREDVIAALGQKLAEHEEVLTEADLEVVG